MQDSCIPGCSCPIGYLDDGLGNCVTIDKCPCTFDQVKILPKQLYTDKCST
jgi:hypothetical protein